MANTYTQILVHIVFAVEGRRSLIKPENNDELQKYITGIVSVKNHKLIAINNMPAPILSDFRGAHAPSRAVSGALAGNIFATTPHRLGDGLRM